MYCTETTPAIATSSEKCTNIVQLKKPQSKKNTIRTQMEPVIKADALDFIASMGGILESIFEQGRYLAERKRFLNPFEYKCFLGEFGWSMPAASKLIKLVQTFGDMGAKALARVLPETLKALCVPKYARIVERMRGRTDLTEILVRQWMKEVKPPKIAKPRVVAQEGWQRTADGARCFQIAPIHNDEVGLHLLQLAQVESLLPHQLVEKLVEKEFHFVTSQPDIEKKTQVDSRQIRDAQDWRGVEKACEKDGERFKRAIAQWKNEQKWQLVKKLAIFLDNSPQSFCDLGWLPTGLLIQGLGKSLLKKLATPLPVP